MYPLDSVIRAARLIGEANDDELAFCHETVDGIKVKWRNDFFILTYEEGMDLLAKLRVVATALEEDDDLTQAVWASKTMLRYGGKRYPIRAELFYHLLDQCLENYKSNFEARHASQKAYNEIWEKLGLLENEQ